MKKELYKNPNVFINRKIEKKYFLNYFASLPRNIMFVYGPKSTGKTTLIYKIISEELNRKEYDINFINLRSILMTEFKDFRNLFFPEHLKGKIKKTLGTIGEIEAFGFKWNPNEKSIVEKNIFGLMEDRLRKLNKAGIKPIIILDEFQYLKDIYIDDAKEIRLIDELFKLFISITKQFNLAHVVCLTSDSYFLEELYTDTKLSKTSDFYKIDHLSKKDIYYWLEEKEKCPKKMVDDVWKNIGGSVWDIWQIFVEYKNTMKYKHTIEKLIQIEYSRIFEYYDTHYIFEDNEDEEKTFLRVCKHLVKEGKYKFNAKDLGIYDLIKDLVDKDLWFYNILEREITPNSQSVRQGIKQFLKEIKY